MSLPSSLVTQHFSWGEFGSRDGEPVPSELRANVRGLCMELEVLRSALRRPIRVLSGYRSPARNAAVKGAERSQHLLAKAADIRVAGLGPDDVHAEIERLIREGQLSLGGVGLYLPREGRPLGWVHVDTRNGRARWRG